MKKNRHVFLSVFLFASLAMGQSNVNEDTNQAGDDSNMAAILNGAAGAALIAAGVAQKPDNLALIAMGMMALAQAAADSQGSSSAYNTGYDTYGGGYDSAYNDPSRSSSPSSALSPSQQRQYDEGKKALEDGGATWNDDGTATINGQTFTGADFANPDGLADKGLSEEDIESVKEGLDIAHEATKDLKVSHGSGAASLAAAAPNPVFSSETDDLEDDSSRAGDELDRRSSVAGMTRSLAGDQIGVSGDDIFKMLSRRYQKKKSANAFLP